MHDREDVLMALLRAGARGYILKSDTHRHLLAAIEALSMRRPYFSGKISETLLDRFLESHTEEESTTALTPREREIVQLIAEGKINKEIGTILDISVKT